MLDVAVELEPVDSLQELFEHEPKLHPGEPGAETEVRAVATKRHVVVLLAGEIESPGVLEALFVVVGRVEPDGDLVPGFDRFPAEFGVAGGGAAEMHGDGARSKHLFGGGEHQVRPCSEGLPQLRVVHEGPHAVRHRVTSRVVASGDEQGEEVVSCEYSGEEIDIAFNVNYLQEILSTIDSEKIEINFFGSEKSCLITDPNSENLKYVVMPLLI